MTAKTINTLTIPKIHEICDLINEWTNWLTLLCIALGADGHCAENVFDVNTDQRFIKGNLKWNKHQYSSDPYEQEEWCVMVDEWNLPQITTYLKNRLKDIEKRAPQVNWDASRKSTFKYWKVKDV